MKKLHKLHNGDYIDIDSIVSINACEKTKHLNGYADIAARVCIEYKLGDKSSVKQIYFDTYDEATAYREKLAFEVNNN